MRTPLLTAIGLWLAAAAPAQVDPPKPANTTAGQPKPTAPAARVERLLHPVRFQDAGELAKVLAASFRGEAAVAAAPGNALLVTGPREAVEEAVRLADRLDVRPPVVAVEVTLVEVTGKAGEAGGEAPALDLAGPAADLAGKLAALAKAMPGTSVRRIALTATAGQPATTTVGGSVPAVTSVTGSARGGPPGGPGGGFPTQRSFSYRQVGTTAAVTARPEGDGVLVDLSLQDTRLAAKDGAAEDTPAEVVSHTLKGPVRVPAGRTVVAQAVRTAGKAGASTVYVVVTAGPTDLDGRGGGRQ
jgi:type II secretory pathway component GspD/PulD (secretin)